jgi:hypothetical protein
MDDSNNHLIIVAILAFFIITTVLTVVISNRKYTSLDAAVYMENTKKIMLDKAKNFGEIATKLKSEGQVFAAMQNDEYQRTCLARAKEFENDIDKILAKDKTLKDKLNTYHDQISHKS